MNWQWGFPFDFPGFGADGPWGRGRGPKRGFFRSGEVRLALLSLLAEAPGHGYELTEAGRAELGSEDDRIDAIWSRADRWREWGGHMGPDTIEVAVALGRLAKTAFTVASSGSAEAAEQVVERLDLARRELEETKAEG